MQDDGLGPSQLDDAFRESEFEFLILPEDELGETLFALVASDHQLNRVYEDRHYSIFDLRPKTR